MNLSQDVDCSRETVSRYKVRAYNPRGKTVDSRPVRWWGQAQQLAEKACAEGFKHVVILAEYRACLRFNRGKFFLHQIWKQ